MIKKLTGFAVVNSEVGKKVAYSYSEVDENGNIVSSNKRESYVVMTDEVLNAIKVIEDNTINHMNK